MQREKAIIIVGPTAAGKTEYAVEIAERIGGEIVSADSMQIYQYMDIGSAKPSAEELARVRHHLVGEINPTEDFSVFSYQKKALDSMHVIAGQGKVPVVCGGTGLYINSILYKMDFSEAPGDRLFREELHRQSQELGCEFIHEKLKELDPEAAKRIHPNNIKKVIRAIEIARQSGDPVRPFDASYIKNEDFSFTLIGLTRERSELYDRINRRVDLLVSPHKTVEVSGVLRQWGLVDEVKSLLDSGLTEENIAMKGIGYKEIIGYLHGLYDLETAVDLVKKNTRHYAKRQITWFKRLEGIQWVNLSDYPDKEQAVNAMMKMLNS